jgi:signal peptidase I
VVPVGAGALAVMAPLAMLLGAAFLFGWKFQPIETASMAPRYPAGSLAVVEPIDASGVEPGITIVFEDPGHPGRLVAHRVLKVLPGTALAWQTQGDANAEPDPFPVPARAIGGRVRWSIPALGAVVTAVRGPQAVVLLVGLPLLLFVAFEIRDLRRRKVILSLSVGRALSATLVGHAARRARDPGGGAGTSALRQAAGCPGPSRDHEGCVGDAATTPSRRVTRAISGRRPPE